MTRTRLTILTLLALAALGAGAVLSGGAGAAPRVRATAAPRAHAAAAVTLNLKGGIGNRSIRACRIRHHYTLYRRGTPVAFSGTVAGAPASFSVKVKVKQCSRGVFVTRYSMKVAGSGGSFRGTLRTAGRGFFFARASFNGPSGTLKSDKQYFKGS
jgi:hypothetical protein